MANTFTTNLNLTKPEVGADTDAWGGHLNTDLDTLDGIFAAAGTGTSVGLNVGSGKTLNVAGTFISPTIIGGTAASSTLTLESTSGVGTSDAILFKTGSQNERMRIDASGNVGIGTSSTGGFRFAVVGSTASSVPLYLNTDATNSFVYSPNPMYVGSTGAYAFNIVTNNTVRATIDSSGNVGIGTSSPSTYGKLAVNGNVYAGDLISTSDGTITIGSNGAGSVAITRTGTGATNSSMTFSTTFATLQERMRIDSLGNVGIGTTSPNAKLEVYGQRVRINAAADPGVELANTTTVKGYMFYDTTNDLVTLRHASTGTGIAVNSSGNVLVGTTAVGLSNSSSFTFQPSSQYSVFNKPSGSASGAYYIYFGYNAGTIGSITQNGTTGVLFNTASDYRLKENVQPMTTGLATISALKPVSYNWISDKSRGEGFIAHELQAIIPGAVTGKKDDVDKDGKIQPQGVDYSKIVVHLVAALQELKAEFDAYKASHA